MAARPVSQPCELARPLAQRNLLAGRIWQVTIQTPAGVIQAVHSPPLPHVLRRADSHGQRTLRIPNVRHELLARRPDQDFVENLSPLPDTVRPKESVLHG